MIIYIGLLASVTGFCIAVYIHRKQRAKKPLMCPRRAPCETVLSSRQAKTLGASNAVLGMYYYAVMTLFLVSMLFGNASFQAVTILFVLTGGGFLFSLYLVGVQHFVIKQWCAWCLGSAAAATVLFLSAFVIFL
jgi:uncharacterized membrane protein